MIWISIRLFLERLSTLNWKDLTRNIFRDERSQRELRRNCRNWSRSWMNLWMDFVIWFRNDVWLRKNWSPSSMLRNSFLRFSKVMSGTKKWRSKPTKRVWLELFIEKQINKTYYSWKTHLRKNMMKLDKKLILWYNRFRMRAKARNLRI
jgi:hypothetical protein